MTTRDASLPPEFAAANRLEYDYAEGEGPDFFPFEEFLPADEALIWLRRWTGNPEVDHADFRIFGKDSTGGHAAVWLAKPGAALVDQPVVFLGSEGETGVVAADFWDYLSLLATGIGPSEAIIQPEIEGRVDPAVAHLLSDVRARKRSRAEVSARAAAEFPTFRGLVDSLCR